MPTEERLLFIVYYYQYNSWQVSIVVSETLMTHSSLFALSICAMILKYGYEKVAARELLRTNNTRTDIHSLTHWHVCTYEHVCTYVRTYFYTLHVYIRQWRPIHSVCIEPWRTLMLLVVHVAAFNLLLTRRKALVACRQTCVGGWRLVV